MTPSEGIAAAAQAIRKAGGKVRTRDGGLRVELQQRGRAIGDDQLALVTPLAERVHTLVLRDTGISDEGLQHVAKLPNLRRLHLERTAITDAGMRAITNLKHLEYLNLYGTAVGDRTLEALHGMKGLKQLFVWETKVSDEGCRRLERALPDLQIIRGVDLDEVAAAAARAKAKDEAIELVKLPWIPAGEGDPPRSKTGEFTTVTITNARAQPVKLYWVEYGGGLRFYADIAAGASLKRNTFSEATWVITDKNETMLGHFIATLKPSQITIPAPPD